MQSNEINEIAKALAEFQQVVKDAKLDSVNPHFKSKFSSLSAIYAACRPLMGKYGLSFTHIVEPNGEGMLVSTLLMHSSGQWIKSSMPVHVDHSKPQAVGSGISYGRRYTLAAIVGISDTEDDDANEAQNNPAPKPETKYLTKEQKNILAEALNEDSYEWFYENLKKIGFASLDVVPEEKFKGLMKSIENKKAAK